MRPTRTTRTVATLAVAAGTVVSAAPAFAQTAPPVSPVTNVIYLLGDGMGVTHITAARERYYGAAGRLNMERSDAVGKVSTYAVEEGTAQPALVTDSASSATAWSSGVKTYNAALGVDAFGKRVDTLMEQAKRAGMRTGDVSTAEITDATPAGMVSHVLLRGCQGPVYTDATCLGTGPDGKPRAVPADRTLITPVAEQIARNGTADVVLGGGLARFEPDDQQALQAQGYTVLGSYGDPALAPGQQTAQTQRAATRTELQAVASDKVIGLFNRGNMTVETVKSATGTATATATAQEPTLAEMTSKAISLLDKKNSKGFLLQVEGALIDKRSHANDATQTLGEVKAFDDAVEVAMDFARKDGHTLVLTTADHECAGFNIVEKGSITNAEAKNFPGTGNVDSGNTANSSLPVRSGSQTKDVTRSSGPNNAPGSSAGNFAPAYFRSADDPASLPDGDSRDSLWLTYLSGNHTGADVNIFATGPGAQQFAGSQDNTDLYRKMYSALSALGNVQPTASPTTVSPRPTTTQSPAKKPLTFRTIVQGRGNGKVLVAVNDVAAAQPGARVDLFIVDRGVQTFVRRLQLNAAGRTTTTPATFVFTKGTSPTFTVRIQPVDGVSAVTTSTPFTGYAS